MRKLMISLFLLLNCSLVSAQNEEQFADIRFSVWVMDTQENFIDGSRIPRISYVSAGEVETLPRLRYNNRYSGNNYYGPLPLVFFEEIVQGETPDGEPIIRRKEILKIRELPSLTGSYLFILLPVGRDSYRVITAPDVDLSQEAGKAAIFNIANERVALKIGEQMRAIDPFQLERVPIQSENGRMHFQLALYSDQQQRWRLFYRREFAVNPEDRALILVYRRDILEGPWRVMPIVFDQNESDAATIN